MPNTKQTVDPHDVLDTFMGPNDAEAVTIREYLKALLTEIWGEGEGFSGKRPFGNSGWEYELYEALAESGHIDFERDVDGYFVTFDKKTANRLIYEAIAAL